MGLLWSPNCLGAQDSVPRTTCWHCSQGRLLAGYGFGQVSHDNFQSSMRTINEVCKKQASQFQGVGPRSILAWEIVEELQNPASSLR